MDACNGVDIGTEVVIGSGDGDKYVVGYEEVVYQLVLVAMLRDSSRCEFAD